MTMMTEKQMKQMRAQKAAAKRRELKRKRVMRNRMILACVIIALAMIIAGVGIIVHTSKADAAEETVYEFVPTHTGTFVEFSHTVKGGESLGTIAARYIQQYGSDEAVDDVVDRIISFNGFDRKEVTYHLHAGQKLTIPMWIAEDRNPHHTDSNYSCKEESQNN